MPGQLLYAAVRSTSPPDFSPNNATSSAPPSPSLSRAHPHARPEMNQAKRASISTIKDLTNKHIRKKSKDEPKAFGWIDLDIESPPLLLHGPKDRSTGAMFSGVLHLHVNSTHYVITSWKASIMLQIKTKKPVRKDCSRCSQNAHTVREWNLRSDSSVPHQQLYTHPINHMFTGSSPTTTHTHIGDINWILKSTAETACGKTITYEMPLSVKRALQPFDEPHVVKRKFPQADFLLKILEPHLIYPSGDIALNISIYNIEFKNLRTLQTQYRWRVREAKWTLQESVAVVMASCERHRNLPENAKRGILTQDERQVASGVIRDIWKYDTDSGNHTVMTEQGPVEMGGKCELDFNIALSAPQNVACDIDTSSGFSVSHDMVIDVLMCEDAMTLDGHGNQRGKWTVTGLARCLRAKFTMVVTERAGRGISWDLEVPPIYHDVPESPPKYDNVVAYD